MTSSDTKWGCAAVGRAGDLLVEVEEEAVSEPGRWRLSFDHPRIHIRFAIQSASVVTEARDFFDHHLDKSSSGAELRIGTVANRVVSLIKDDEFDDRFFVIALAADGAIRYTIKGNDARHFIAALTRANEDLS